MPRIDAATVAEHRARQREALLDAAEAILLDDGYDALDFHALGRRAGLARNSIYRYFASRDELIAELCERDVPAWIADLDAALARERTASGKAGAYVRVQLEMVAAGRHRLAVALAGAPLPAATLARIHALPGRASARLQAALAEARHPRPRIAAALATGIVNAAIQLLHEDEEPAAVTAIAVATARRAVREAAAG